MTCLLGDFDFISSVSPACCSERLNSAEGKGFLDLIMGVSNQLRGFRRFKVSQLADMVGHPAWKSGIEDLIRKYRWFSN